MSKPAHEAATATGVVRGIAWRPEDGHAMHLADVCTVSARRGIDAENRRHGKREVTLLSQESWSDVCRDLGVELPWHVRRANFLIEGLDLAAAIGRTLRIGEVCVYVHGETKPCGLMDQQHPGLREALVSHCRGGVYAQVRRGGTVRVADRVTVLPNSRLDAPGPAG